jgi:hypothetical protein
MIPKVTSQQFPSASYSPGATRPGGPGRPDFQSLLESRLAAVTPVEDRILALLVEIINKIMINPEEGVPPFYAPLPLSGGPGSAPAVLPGDAVVLEEVPPDRPGPERRRQKIDEQIQEAAVRHGLDADLIRAVIEVESRFDPQAVSPVGARGLMQLMPATSTDLGVQNPFDPGQNIEGGTRYLKQLLERYGGNRRLALAAYNWGMGNLEKRPEAMPLETRRYLVKVEKAYQRYAGETLTRAVARV